MINKPQANTVIVIGGAGFIGSHLVDALVKQNFRVRVVDNLEPQVHPDGQRPSYLNPRAEFIRQDVRDYDGLRSVLLDADAVFYLAGAVGVGDSMYRIRHYVDVNVLGGANLLDILANHKSIVRKIILASSVTVYGEGKYTCPRHGVVFPSLRSKEQVDCRQWELLCPQKEHSTRCSAELTPLPTDEEKLATPMSVYAITKRTQEDMFLGFGRTYGIPVAVLRYFNVYGSRQAISNPYTGVGKILASQIGNGKVPLIYEDGLQVRDFVHVSDVVRANILALQREEADGEIFNVGTGKPTTILDVGRALGTRLGSDLQLQASHLCRAGDVRHCWADISKIRARLGFVPQVVFPAGIDDLLAFAESAQDFGVAAQAHVELTQRGLIS